VYQFAHLNLAASALGKACARLYRCFQLCKSSRSSLLPSSLSILPNTSLAQSLSSAPPNPLIQLTHSPFLLVGFAAAENPEGTVSLKLECSIYNSELDARDFRDGRHPSGSRHIGRETSVNAAQRSLLTVAAPQSLQGDFLGA
jgi:hypothetical protein